MADLTGMMQAAAGAGGEENYIEDVFNTYLYAGNSSTQTITNNIDLATEGGLIWIKATNPSFNFNQNLSDTSRGTGKFLSSNTTAAAGTDIDDITAFNTTGFAIGSNQRVNDSAYRYVSWTWRKQPKFFDIQTWTGTGSNRTIAHALGSVPGCIMVKRTDTTGNWQVYHRANTASPETDYLVLNDTAATADSDTRWNDTAPTSAVFSLGTEATVNASGGTYVAYLFAHNAGGFGLSGTDNVISCGAFTTDGAGAATVNLGYEPQWVIFKDTVNADSWYMFDNMRGMSMNISARTTANGTYGDGVESPTRFFPSATGFTLNAGLVSGSATNIYIAIRRGPMKVPELGTSVFSPITSSAVSGTQLTTNFPVDMQIAGYRVGVDGGNWSVNDRLRGVSSTTTEFQKSLETSNTLAEITGSSNETLNWSNIGFKFPSYWGGLSTIFYNFKRAPSVFDEVCYTGDSLDPKTVAHNLGKAPELMIFKARDVPAGWRVWGGNMAITEYLALSEDSAVVGGTTFFGSTLPTATSFYVGSGANTSGRTMVAYLFATCAGVSKVGSYTGTGTTQTINCGFTAGSRFIMIKRTDSTGDWYVWDSARGIIAGNDPYLLLNSTAAEVTGTDYVDTAATGFELTSTAPAAINASGGNYIFLAIA